MKKVFVKPAILYSNTTYFSMFTFHFAFFCQLNHWNHSWATVFLAFVSYRMVF